MSYAPLDLRGKIAVVIGGTSGIGRAIAHGLADAGADVVPTSRREDQVEFTAKEIEQRGRRTLRQTSDVADRASLERLLQQAVSRLGKVDILINSAGKTRRTPTIDVPESEYDSLACNVLTTAPRKIVVVAGNPITRSRIEAAGCTVSEFDGSEICIPGNGGPTCLTRPLVRG